MPGVALTDALEETGALSQSDGGWMLTAEGERRLERLGIDIGQLRHGRCVLIRPCLD